VNRDATIAWMQVLIRFGSEGPMTHLLSTFSSSGWWWGNVPFPVPFMSFCVRDSVPRQTPGANFRKCRQFRIML